MKPSEVLHRAADYMQEHGKCTGTSRDAKGRVCAIGALRVVGSPGATRRVHQWLGESSDVVGRIADWSDRDSDKRRVIRGLRKAARLAEAAGE